jgi:hypothetical protein
MRRAIHVLTAVLAGSLLLTAAALAVYPKVPSKWSGGNGKGAPVGFNLSKKGKATFALAEFDCKDPHVSGIAVASSKHPSGKVSKSGKLLITYSSKVGSEGIVKVKMNVTFPTKTSAKVSATFSNAKCKNSKMKYTAAVVTH